VNHFCGHEAGIEAKRSAVPWSSAEAKVKRVQFPVGAELDDAPVIIERLRNAGCIDHESRIFARAPICRVSG